MQRAVFVYTTYPSLVEAEKAGHAIVEQRLAACVNILPGMVSHYWWEGKIERAKEVLMIIKTRASMAEPVRGQQGTPHLYYAGFHGFAGGKHRPRIPRLAHARDRPIASCPAHGRA